MMWELDVLEKVPCRHPGEKCRDETSYIHSWEVTCLIFPSHRYFWTNSAVAWCKNKEATQTFIQSASQRFDQCRLAAATEYVAVGPVVSHHTLSWEKFILRGAEVANLKKNVRECERKLLQVQLWFMKMVNTSFLVDQCTTMSEMSTRESRNW